MGQAGQRPGLGRPCLPATTFSSLPSCSRKVSREVWLRRELPFEEGACVRGAQDPLLCALGSGAHWLVEKGCPGRGPALGPSGSSSHRTLGHLAGVRRRTVGGRGRAGHVLRALGPRAQALGSSPEMSGQPLVCTLLSSGTSASPEGCAWRVTLLCHLGSPGIIQYLSVCVWPAPLTRLSSSSIRVAAHRSF